MEIILEKYKEVGNKCIRNERIDNNKESNIFNGKENCVCVCVKIVDFGKYGKLKERKTRLLRKKTGKIMACWKGKM